MFAAFIILPTRFWPRNDRELPFLAIAQKKNRTIEQRPSRWGSGSAVTVVAKSDGSPRFCIDCRCTINKGLIIRKSCPIPDMEAHIDTAVAAGTIFFTVCDMQSAYELGHPKKRIKLPKALAPPLLRVRTSKLEALTPTQHCKCKKKKST